MNDCPSCHRLITNFTSTTTEISIRKLTNCSHNFQDGKLTISSAFQGIITYDGILEPILNLANNQNIANYQPVLEVPKNSTIESLSGNIQGDLYLDKVTIHGLDISL